MTDTQAGLMKIHKRLACHGIIAMLGTCAFALPASSRVIYRAGAGNRPPAITIKGELVQADLEAFRAAAETAQQEAATSSARDADPRRPRPGPVNVNLDSRGGNIWVAMSIGRVIKQYAFMTRVELGSSCVSACVYVLAAGQGRYVGGRVGIHRPYLPNDGVTSARAKKAQYEGIHAQSRQYLEEMDVPASLHERMMQTPPDRVTWLSEQDLSTYGLTQVVRPPPKPP